MGFNSPYPALWWQGEPSWYFSLLNFSLEGVAEVQQCPLLYLKILGMWKDPRVWTPLGGPPILRTHLLGCPFEKLQPGVHV